MKELKEYAVYKGESLRCMGTAEECAAEMGVKLSTFRHYCTPTHHNRVHERNVKRMAKRKKPTNSTIAICLDEESDL